LLKLLQQWHFGVDGIAGTLKTDIESDAEIRYLELHHSKNG